MGRSVEAVYRAALAGSGSVVREPAH